MTYAISARQTVPTKHAISVLTRCVIEARPTVLVIFLLRFLCGSALVVEHTGGVTLARIVIGSLAWELAIFFAYLFNGVMDVREDQINASRRPIASGALSARTAGRVAWGAAALSICCAATLGFRFTAAIAVILVLGYLYSAPPLYLKRRAFGTAVSVAIPGVLTYYGGYASAGGKIDGALPALAIIMSLWMALIGPPTKDLPDVVGDAAAGRRTLAVLIEESKLRSLTALTALGLATVFLALANGRFPVLLGPALAMLTGSVSVAMLCLSRCSREGRTHRRRPYRAFMATQYGTHLAVLMQAIILS